MPEAIAQIITVHFNSMRNAYGGERNTAYRMDVYKKESLKQVISDILKDLLKRNVAGYVLVKYGGKFYICESNRQEPDGDYYRNEINWHPFQNKFTI